MNEASSFLDVGIDYTAPEFGPGEREAMLAWYADFHDIGGCDLAPFAPFWIDVDPRGFKALKRHLLTLDSTEDPDALPGIAGVLMYAFGYAALGNGPGALYEIVAARRLGVPRSAVVELIRVAALAGGPLGMNSLARTAADYFRRWEGDDRSTPPAVVWPRGWSANVEFFRSGIDPTQPTIDGEVDLIREWHRRAYGDVPGYIDVLAATRPEQLKTTRLREESCYEGELPSQLHALFKLHLGVALRDGVAIRRASVLSARLGVSRGQFLAAVGWASVAGGEAAFEFAWNHAERAFGQMA